MGYYGCVLKVDVQNERSIVSSNRWPGFDEKAALKLFTETGKFYYPSKLFIHFTDSKKKTDFFIYLNKFYQISNLLKKKNNKK